MSRIVLAGGSGFLGSALSAYLVDKSIEVVNLTRRPRIRPSRVRDVEWDGRTAGAWIDELRGARAIVNFTGRSVDCRYNAKHRAEIIGSRVDSVRAVGAAIRATSEPPAVWIQASSLAIYGNAGDRICDESAPHGTGFSESVCEEWERATIGESTPSTRKVILRIGFALGRGGGALQKLARLARLGLGGTVGSGKQWISWLEVDDLNRIIMWAIEDHSASGVYNATGPTPVRNRNFMRELRRTLGVSFGPPAPAIAVHLGSLLMRTEASLALTGRRCIPARLTGEGFNFQHTDLTATLGDLLADHAGGI